MNPPRLVNVIVGSYREPAELVSEGMLDGERCGLVRFLSNRRDWIVAFSRLEGLK